MSKPTDASTLWFTSAQLGSLIVEYGDIAAQPGGLDFGIAALDQHIIPARTGQLNFIVARPGHGKTTFGAIRARRAAELILKRGTQNSECVVVISLDQAVEEVFAMMTAGRAFSTTDLAWGRVSHADLVKHATATVHLPIRMIGKSAVQRSNTSMTFDEIFAALDDIYTVHKIRPVHVLLDYIQIARTGARTYQNKAEQVADAVLRASDLSYKYGCSMDICAQAGREVDRNAIKLPTLADCQWASAIEQEGYRVFSVWRPMLTEPETLPSGMRNQLNLGGKQYPVESNLFVLRVLKHKMTEAGQTFALRLDPDRVQLNGYTTA